MRDKVTSLGQVFTPNWVVEKMLALKQNTGSILEPSVGTGRFWEKIETSDKVGLEIDKRICAASCINIDFFSYTLENKFDTIIGNPPYVAFKHIIEETKEKLDLARFDKRTNLYVFFIVKCLDHLREGGELIFITPREFLQATSCRSLNQKIFKEGTLTHFFDLGEQTIFKGYSPNCVIWRFEKGNFSHDTIIDEKGTLKRFYLNNGILSFCTPRTQVPLTDLFFVRVGAVSGADKIFHQPQHSNQAFVYSATKKRGDTKKMIYNIPHEALLPYKKDLLSRKIKKFKVDDWYKWGRDYFKTHHKRIYVNCKTRNDEPFFAHSERAYDGSILALFLKDKTTLTEAMAAQMLNLIDWKELGFVCGGRYLFSQRALESASLDRSIVEKFLRRQS